MSFLDQNAMSMKRMKSFNLHLHLISLFWGDRIFILLYHGVQMKGDHKGCWCLLKNKARVSRLQTEIQSNIGTPSEEHEYSGQNKEYLWSRKNSTSLVTSGTFFLSSCYFAVRINPFQISNFRKN
jgi:hypothetical protein